MLDKRLEFHNFAIFCTTVDFHTVFKGSYCKETKKKETKESNIKSLKEDALEILDKNKGARDVKAKIWR
jgi:hypothetical protein